MLFDASKKNVTYYMVFKYSINYVTFARNVLLYDDDSSAV